MASSMHLQVRDAILAAMKAAGVADENVQRGRAWPMPEGVNALVKVYLDSSQSQEFTLGGYPIDWTTRIRCEFLARGDDNANAEDAADALMVAGIEAVLADTTLGQRGEAAIQPIGLAWGTEEADTSIGVAQCVFQVVHRTAATTIAA